MAFCANCGQELINGAKFCANCAAANETNMNTQRITVYEGAIHKCPNCGEVLGSFQTNCPSCGFEFSGKRVNSKLEKFIDEINECDRLIANNPEPKRAGWSSWSKRKRTLWVIINIVTCGIPLFIYLYAKVIFIILALARYGSTPKLTPDEKRKASLIENFLFPNEREAILEALLYINTKISFLVSEKINQKNAYWTRLWSVKADQLYQKAEMMFKGDPVANNAYKEIALQKERVAKTVKIKAVTYTVLLVTVILFILVRNGINNDTDYSAKTDYSANFEWQTNGLFVHLPKPKTTSGKITLESEKQIQFELYNVSDDQFEAYVQACRNNGYKIGITKTDSVFYADNEDGLDLYISYNNRNDVMHVSLNSYSMDEK